MNIYFKFLFVVSFSTIATFSFGQKASFSGTWLLKKRTNLYGKDFVNGLPKRIKVVQYDDSIVITRTNINENNEEYEYSETLYFSGEASTFLTRTKRKYNSVIKWTEDQSAFSEENSYFFVNKRDTVEFARTEDWKLLDPEGYLTIIKKHASRVLESDMWSMKGVYQKIKDAQEEIGIRFEKHSTWSQILRKAKSENKYIFIDCYTTWCAPCKRMENEIYSSIDVGNYFNDRMVAIKLQFDTTAGDNEDVKRWHDFANKINREYNINAFPTFLFFSPEGKIVHKGIGYKNVEDFINLAKISTDSSKQYYTLIGKYLEGKLQYPEIKDLAIMAKSMGDKDLSNKIARDYINNYLVKLGEVRLFTESNFLFITSFPGVVTSKDKSFHLFYLYGNKIDSCLNRKGFAEGYVDYLITKEIVNPKLDEYNKNNNLPRWDDISKVIENTYTKSYATRNILNAKVKWYKARKDWKNYIDYLVEQIERYGLKTRDSIYNKMILNNSAWDVFTYSNQKESLNLAVKWVNRAIENDSSDFNSLDTKANLLYKLGRVEEAIALEKLAINIGETEEKKRGNFTGTFTKVYRERLMRMQDGKPTWE